MAEEMRKRWNQSFARMNKFVYPYLEVYSHTQLVSPSLEPLKKISTWYPYFFLVKTPCPERCHIGIYLHLRTALNDSRWFVVGRIPSTGRWSLADAQSRPCWDQEDQRDSLSHVSCRYPKYASPAPAGRLASAVVRHRSFRNTSSAVIRFMASICLLVRRSVFSREWNRFMICSRQKPFLGSSFFADWMSFFRLLVQHWRTWNRPRGCQKKKLRISRQNFF